MDVGSAVENDLFNYGDSLNGFWVLLKKLNPFGKSVKILNMEEIQVNLFFKFIYLNFLIYGLYIS